MRMGGKYGTEKKKRNIYICAKNWIKKEKELFSRTTLNLQEKYIHHEPILSVFYFFLNPFGPGSYIRTIYYLY